MEIKCIVFDLGNVLISYQPEIFHIERGATKEETDTFIRDVYHSPEWQLIDKGEITVREAISSIARRSALSAQEIASIFDYREELLFPIVQNTKLLKSLKNAGIDLYFLSNFPEDMFELLSSKHDFFGEFSGGVVSSAEKLLKPQPEIYQLLIERYGLSPEETLFIDDLLPNIEGAAAAGFRTLHLEDHRNLGRELASLFPGVF